jgi:lipopolysaccharide export system protein LptA
VTRRGFGAVLATASAAGFLLVWLALAPAGASERSSAAPIAPKDLEAPASRAPEGDAVAASAVEPIRLAANEQDAGKPAAEAQTAARAPAAPAAPDRPGILQVDTDEPLSIKADELEAIEEPDGRRRLVFNRQVNVDQGGLQVRSDRLEAHYAANATQPDRLVASGNVRVRQEERELSCANATYYPARERLECTGNAQLRDGANRVSGETIEILFGEDRIRVKGGAMVNVTPDAKKKPAPKAAPAGEPPAVGATP